MDAFLGRRPGSSSSDVPDVISAKDLLAQLLADAGRLRNHLERINSHAKRYVLANDAKDMSSIVDNIFATVDKLNAKANAPHPAHTTGDSSPLNRSYASVTSGQSPISSHPPTQAIDVLPQPDIRVTPQPPPPFQVGQLTARVNSLVAKNQRKTGPITRSNSASTLIAPSNSIPLLSSSGLTPLPEFSSSTPPSLSLSSQSVVASSAVAPSSKVAMAGKRRQRRFREDVLSVAITDSTFENTRRVVLGAIDPIENGFHVECAVKGRSENLIIRFKDAVERKKASDALKSANISGLKSASSFTSTIRASYLAPDMTILQIRKALSNQNAAFNLSVEKWQLRREIKLDNGLSHYLLSAPRSEIQLVEGQKLYIGSARSTFQSRPRRQTARQSNREILPAAASSV